jgi:PEP-CTERM motif
MRFVKTLIVACMFFGLPTFNAVASLTLGASDGKSVVYSSLGNITWTGDANLLGTLESTLGFNNVLNAIIAAKPTINDTANFIDTPAYSGHFTVSALDFDSVNLGRTSWYSYGGSNQWALPSAGANPQIGYNQAGSQFGQLFYNELGGVAFGTMPDTSNFTNEQVFDYWSGTEFIPSPSNAWKFSPANGSLGTWIKGVGINVGFTRLYPWAVSPGNIAAVPVPAAMWLFGVGLIGMLCSKKRLCDFRSK